MSLVNYSTREITCKIVYYGPGLSSKTRKLQYVHAYVPDERKGPMVSLATETDRTLFFDFLPLDLGTMSGFRTRFQLYTVPARVHYNATRKLLLRGADGVVFIADSQREQLDENLDSLRSLHDDLLEENIDVRSSPTALQYNKRDLPGVLDVATLDDALNFRCLPAFPAAAVAGDGVFDTVRAVSQLVLQNLSRRFGQEIGQP